MPRSLTAGGDESYAPRAPQSGPRVTDFRASLECRQVGILSSRRAHQSRIAIGLSLELAARIATGARTLW